MVHLTVLPIVSSLAFAAWASPTVKVDSATFLGSTVGNTETFLGIPYAKPPIGENRFRLPQPLQRYQGTYNASESGPRCPQQKIRLPAFEVIPPGILDVLTGINSEGPQDEDCLTIDVVRPVNISPTTKLPVVVWIYGGAFQLGSTRDNNGTLIVERSIALGKPIVYVAMNYRISGLGFMPGKEIKAAKVGNLGFQDQRAALRWVQKYIARFGGDASKTSIWGISAGAISVAFQMTANGGNQEGLFQGAFMQSGAPIAIDDLERGQKYYDAVVKETGCSATRDTLACLRKVPFAKLKVAIDNNPSAFDYQALLLAYGPRVDGNFIKEHPSQLVLSKKVAKVPFITGDPDDEGTLFALSTANITESSQLKEYLHQFYFPKASSAQLDELLELYPADPAAGSPFDTGDQNAMTPQYKRISAIWGDIAFVAPRRLFLQAISDRQPSWSYLHKRPKQLPFLGALHGGDNFYGGGELLDYLVQFVNHLDPNGQGAPWPKYTTFQPNLLTLNDAAPLVNITRDNFRTKGIAFLNKFLLNNPI